MYDYPIWYAPTKRRRKNGAPRPLSLAELQDARDELNKFIEAEIEKKEKGKKDKPGEKPKAPSFNLLEVMALVFFATWAQSFLGPLVPHLIK